MGTAYWPISGREMSGDEGSYRRRESTAVYVAPSPRSGYGVFARRSLAAGDIVEECVVLIVSAENRTLIDQTELRGYYYGWNDGAAFALGCGSLYNHSRDPNAEHHKLLEQGLVVIQAIRSIAEGEEITINYGKYSGAQGVGFTPRD
jgi:uncharacterized protein